MTPPTFPKCKLFMFQVYMIEYYLFSDFRNDVNVLRAKIISNLSPPVPNNECSYCVCLMVHPLPQINSGDGNVPLKSVLFD